MADCPTDKRTAWHCRRADGGCGEVVGYRVLCGGHWGFEPEPGLLIVWRDGKICVCCQCGRIVEIREERG